MKLSDLLEEKRKEKAKKEKVKNTKIATTGVVLGATVGAIGALLLAPKSGKDTRKALSEKSKEVANRVGEKVKETKVAIDNKINSTEEDGKRSFFKKNKNIVIKEDDELESKERKDV